MDGTLRIASDANLGTGSGQVMLDGGMLSVTASTNLDRALALGASCGTLELA